MSEWDNLKKRRSEFVTNTNSKEQDYIDYLLAEGDKLRQNTIDEFVRLAIIRGEWHWWLEDFLQDCKDDLFGSEEQ